MNKYTCIIAAALSSALIGLSAASAQPADARSSWGSINLSGIIAGAKWG